LDCCWPLPPPDCCEVSCSGVSGLDPVFYLVVPVTLIAVATIATWLPARRAARIDAIHALCAE
jgi:ABC-type antimicrobial peptide transport system permease subunit